MKIQEVDPLLVEVPVPIQTPRLLIRPPQKGDGAALFEAKAASWPELQSWMPWAQDKDEHSVERDEIMCRRKHAEFLLRNDLMMLVFDRHTLELLASSGLHRMNWRTRLFEIGFWVRSDRTRIGIATELTNALIRFGFAALSANKIYICHDKENIASARVIDKLGFKPEGESRVHGELNGIIRTRCHYGRYNAECLPELDVSWPMS